MKKKFCKDPHQQATALLSVLTIATAGAVTGCICPTPDPHPSPSPSYSASSGTAVCDPLGNGSTGSLGAGQGLIANLAYLANTSNPHYSSVFDFEKQAVPISNPVYLSQLDIPTEYFEQGFVTGNGTQLTNASGQKLVEYFSLHIQSVLELGASDQDGDYQFAIASDDGSVVTIDQGNGPQTLINNDGDHPTQLGCAETTVHLDHTSHLPLTVDYYQGPPNNIALILLWRRVDTAAKWCSSGDWGADIPHSLNDPYCGQNGNNLFFNWSEQPGSVSTPNQNWINLLARGWSVVPAQDYYLPSSSGPNPCNTGNECYTDTFKQPGQSSIGSADLLIVTDSSQNYSRSGLASSIQAFSQQLPQGSSFQVGVMVGNSSSSQWHGRLWHAPGVSPALSSSSLSASDISSLMSQDLSQLPSDPSSKNGEMGLYSLSSSLSGSLLSENQSEGFYNAAAALGVVFVSDSGDLCSTDGYAHPECSGITPASVLAQLQALKSGKPLSVNAIVPIEGWFGDTDDGAGYTNIAQLAGGQIFDLDPSRCTEDDNSVFSEAMSKIGQAMAAQMKSTGTGQLSDDFTLSHAGVDLSTITVTVDGDSTQYRYNGNDNQVDLQDAGTYGSVVEVNYCLAPNPTPSPSVSATPSPTPSPTVSVTPSPTPSPSVSVTPSPTPSPTVSVTPSPTPSPTVSVTPSPTPSPTVSVTPSPTPSPSVSVTPSPTPSPSVSVTPSPTPSPSVSVTPSPTPSPSVSVTPSPTPSPSVSVTPSPTPSPSVSVTPSPTPSPSVSVTPSPTPSPSVSVTPSPTPSPSVSVTPSPTPSPSASSCTGPFCGGGVLGQ